MTVQRRHCLSTRPQGATMWMAALPATVSGFCLGFGEMLDPDNSRLLLLFVSQAPRSCRPCARQGVDVRPE
jgi:hypothetical protein